MIRKTDRVTKVVGCPLLLGNQKVLFPRDRRGDTPLLGYGDPYLFAYRHVVGMGLYYQVSRKESFPPRTGA